MEGLEKQKTALWSYFIMPYTWLTSKRHVGRIITDKSLVIAQRTKFCPRASHSDKILRYFGNDSWLICNCTPNMPITNTNYHAASIFAPSMTIPYHDGLLFCPSWGSSHHYYCVSGLFKKQLIQNGEKIKEETVPNLYGQFLGFQA